ncbi:hypothetical protein, partial [Haladaptatus sp. R4]|uniref:hypothetical protein n=1 Tax=Haladaptatus sp. R4 TaxID=1679489 RepID=UPI001680EFB8
TSPADSSGRASLSRALSSLRSRELRSSLTLLGRHPSHDSDEAVRRPLAEPPRQRAPLGRTGLPIRSSYAAREGAPEVRPREVFVSGASERLVRASL